MVKIDYMSCDIETYSDIDLKKCGIYKYAESPNFEILLFAYSFNGGEVIVKDLSNGEKVPIEVISALSDKTITKWAFNSSFERICLSEWLRRNHPDHFNSYSTSDDTVGNYLDPSSWRCSMIWSAYLGLPLSLDGVGSVLGLEEQKMKEGKPLIHYFCKPCAVTKTNGGRTRNLPEHDPDKWEFFKEYNKRDVQVEMSIQHKLSRFPVPEFIWDEYHIDQEINDRGIALDMEVVENAIKFDTFSKAALIATMKNKTELENPNSVQQVKEWLSNKGIESESLDKKAIIELLKTVPSDVVDVLLLRQQLARSSVKKYQAMQSSVCADGRARGMFQFYGANRSGRWAGRIIQLQNLPQNHISDLDEARAIVKLGDYDLMNILYEDVPDTLSQLIRTAFVPRPGYKLIVSDFSAIEARVLSHLAHETWRSKVFANNEDIYCATASKMFGVPVEKHGANAHLRQKGKTCELALGYGGSCAAIRAFSSADVIPDNELQPLVDAWRTANPNIVAYWWDIDHAVKTAIKQRTTVNVNGIRIYYQSSMLFIKLPSGRILSYVKPKIGENRFGGESVTYEGVGNTKKWERIESYGPKLVENIVQAISRDILMNSMRTLRHCFISGHVHDELIIECSPNVELSSICEQMGRNPNWMPGILLKADGYETQFYKKD